MKRVKTRMAKVADKKTAAGRGVAEKTAARQNTLYKNGDLGEAENDDNGRVLLKSNLIFVTQIRV